MIAPQARRITRVTALLVAGYALTISACSENPLLPSSTPLVPAANALLELSETPEQHALTELTRDVALALSNQGLRNQVRDDLRDSRHTVEHKLELRSYLKGQRGGVLLAQMSKETGVSRDSLLALVRAVRPLEFYMPVPAHREGWTGDANLLVASQLKERDTPVGYNLSGEAVTLDLKQAPATPTLSLVPVETDFTKDVDTRKYHNTHDKNGTTIGTFALVDPCTDPTAPGCEGGTTPPPGVTPDAVYLTESHLVDAHEPWDKGMPELELHVHGPINKDYPLYGEDLTCVGGDATGDKFWDQNPNDWSATIGNGAPLLMSRYNIDQFQSRFPHEAVHYIMWEDDYQACKTVTDRDMKAVLLQAASAAAGAGILVNKTGSGVTVSLAAAAVAFTVDIIKNGASLIYGNDDLVGALIDIRGTPYEASHPGQSHVVMDGGSYNGTARLEFVWATAANGRAFASSVTPSATAVGIDQGQSQTLTATVYDQYGSTMSGHPISWRSNDQSIARIDDDGILHAIGGGNTTVVVRACDPNCMDSPVNVAVTGPTISGPGYVYDDYATMSASVVNPRQSSYYYVWQVSSCSSANCGGTWYSAGAGYNLTNVSTFVSRYSDWVTVQVTIKTSSTGSIVGSAAMDVYGAGEMEPSGCDDPSQIICDPNAYGMGTSAPATLTLSSSAMPLPQMIAAKSKASVNSQKRGSGDRQ